MAGLTLLPGISLTPGQEVFLRTVADDTEEAPWMVMGDGQFWAATKLASSLEAYAVLRDLPWYVGGMLPIRYPQPGGTAIKQVAPDTLVAFVPRRARQSYDLLQEGVFPAFVVEVISPSSVEHDTEDKRLIYEALGAQEYVLYAPRIPGQQRMSLDGYRRTPQGHFEAWLPDQQGRLWSPVLNLYLVAQERDLRAMLPDGTLLPTLEESERARAVAEAEVARLRAELDRLQR